jgi:hypothetical protein
MKHLALRIALIPVVAALVGAAILYLLNLFAA